MQEESWSELLDELIGHRVVVETSDGSIRRGLLSRITGRQMQFAGTACEYPTTVYFDQSEVEGIDIRVIVSIRRDE